MPGSKRVTDYTSLVTHQNLVCHDRVDPHLGTVPGCPDQLEIGLEAQERGEEIHLFFLAHRVGGRVFPQVARIDLALPTRDRIAVEPVLSTCRQASGTVQTRDSSGRCERPVRGGSPTVS